MQDEPFAIDPATAVYAGPRAAALRDLRRADDVPRRRGGGRPPARARGRRRAARGLRRRPPLHVPHPPGVPVLAALERAASRRRRSAPRSSARCRRSSASRRRCCRCSATSWAPPPTTPAARRTCAASRSDGDRLSVRLQRPAGDLPARLAAPILCPVPEGTPAVRGGSRAPLPSAGPYYIASADPGRTVLRRNPNYRGARPRRPDRIVYLTGVSTAEGLRRDGRVDYIPYDFDQHGPLAVGGALDREYGATSAAARRGDRRYYANPLPGLDLLAFNAKRPLFRDAATRRAASRGARPARARRRLERAPDRPLHPALGAAAPTPRPRRRARGAAARRRAPRDGDALLLRRGRQPARRRDRAREPAADRHPRAHQAVAGLPARARSRARPRRHRARHRPPRSSPTPSCSSRSPAATSSGFGDILPSGVRADPASCAGSPAPTRSRSPARDAAFAALERAALAAPRRWRRSASFVRPEYVGPRVGCRVIQGAHAFLDLGAACISPATR